MIPQDPKAAYRAGKAVGEVLKHLTAEERTQVMKRLHVAQVIRDSAHGKRTITARRLADQNGISANTALRWYQNYTKHGIAGLVDARTQENNQAVPEATRSWWTECMLMKSHLRITDVHRWLLRRWKQWLETSDPRLAIPGYSQPPADCGSGHPSGWSYVNFRRYAPSAAATAITRQGRRA